MRVCVYMCLCVAVRYQMFWPTIFHFLTTSTETQIKRNLFLMNAKATTEYIY